MAFKFPFSLKNSYLFDIAVYDTKGESANFIDFSDTSPIAMIKKGKTFSSTTLIEENKHIDPFHPEDAIDIGSYHNILLYIPGMGELLIEHLDDPSAFEFPSGNRAVMLKYKNQNLLIKYDMDDGHEELGLVSNCYIHIDEYGTLEVHANDSAINRVGVLVNRTNIDLNKKIKG